jgi:Ca-activated chloride channel family protein
MHRAHQSLRRVLVLIAFVFAPAADASEAPAEQTLSPYFLVEGGDPAVDRFPLESTHVDVAVSGVIADVTVTQVYKNDGRRPIDARYVFPASTRAAVHGMRMTIGNEVIEAEIQEKKAAQKTFEQAKQAGKSATLLEQKRPNVFTMSVANVMPGDRLEVALRYSELLVPTDGRYELVFPSVIGPRYGNGGEGRAPAAVGPGVPYLAEGEPPPATFSLSGTIAAGLPIQELVSPSHALEGGFESPSLYRFTLGRGEERGADRDFVLRYRLAGDAIQSGLSLFDAGDEKFFLLLVEPPARVPLHAIPPREFVFIVDVSGSMQGFPLDTAKHLIHSLVAKLRPSDRFDVLLFSGGSRLLAPQSLPATEENVSAALAAIDQEQGGGGTELLPALERALALSPEPGLARSFLVLTDGYVEADHAAADFVTRHLGEANVFAFGIGSSVNRYLIEGLAHAGQGEPFVVSEPEDASEVADAFAEYVSSPVLTDVHVDFDGFEAYAVEPGAIPDVLAARPVVVYGKWRGEPRGVIEVSGASGGGAFLQRFDVASTAARPENRPLAQLWARGRIAALSDYGLGAPSDAARGEIVALGLRHSLLTRFTSFVAVSHVVRNRDGAAENVTQPLPLPRGVSSSAVGSATGVASEPELLVLACALVLLGAAHGLLRARRQAA